MYAVLVLEDGTIVGGKGLGAEKEVYGEAVFNTSMCGYQEALTDPSYKGQILMFTYPLMGNYGINKENFESDGIKAEGFIMHESCSSPSHRAVSKTLDAFLWGHDTPGIAGVDTRALTIKIRKYGTMKAALKTSREPIDEEKLLEQIKKQQDISELDLVSAVTSRDIKHYKGRGEKVVLLDCGMKLSILRNLLKRGLDVTVVPPTTPAEEILSLAPAGIVISNGPGDPMRADYAIKTTKKIMEEKPTFGICLGHQILALAAGAKTFKLKFGHRGSNQPVKDVESNRIYITSQNHGYAVDVKSLEGTGFKLSHMNLNDDTAEGLCHEKLPVFSVQYHPEAHPGPKDNEYLFDEFLKIMRGG
ncbi:MAG: glutamine-hydrolyzing carbamoyl-phosphate synthase small subunit [Candidatus Hydrothermarchaeota archaeon]|nr:glutamine-hydrolyzing carbamoyl-phosphate synthase small subunit [Candidatus Hydrothermarchaeota archaeon]